MKIHITLLGSMLCIFVSASANAETITRGPYLQCATTTSIVIRWRTDEEVLSRVAYAQADKGKALVAEGDKPTTEHELQISNLSKATTYHYQVLTNGQATAAPKNDMFRFTTATDDLKTPVRIWALGDCGTGNNSQKAVRDAFYAWNKSPSTNIVLLLGDNAYGKGTDSEYERAIFKIYQDALPNTVFWSTLGNHDAYSKEKINGEVPYFTIFTHPTKGEAGGVASGTEHYYSFDHGPVHFVCLDSMKSDRKKDGAMAKWVEQDLSQNTKPWTIAFWHHPPYSKGSHDSDKEKQLIEMREVFLPILERYGVDLVLGGHSHCYERSFLIDGHYGKSDTLTEAMKKDGGMGDAKKPYQKQAGGNNGAIYVVAGSAGKVSGGKLNHPAMAVSMRQLGSFVIDIQDKTAQGTMIGTDKIQDAFTIIKK